MYIMDTKPFYVCTVGGSKATIFTDHKRDRNKRPDMSIIFSASCLSNVNRYHTNNKSLHTRSTTSMATVPFSSR